MPTTTAVSTWRPSAVPIGAEDRPPYRTRPLRPPAGAGAGRLTPAGATPGGPRGAPLDRRILGGDPDQGMKTALVDDALLQSALRPGRRGTKPPRIESALLDHRSS